MAPATWTETSACNLTLRFGRWIEFAVAWDEGRYNVVLPGRGVEKCWNRAQVERVCREYLDQMVAESSTEPGVWGTTEQDLEASDADSKYQQARESE